MSSWPQQLKALLGPQALIDPASCLAYGYDNSKQVQAPRAVVLAESTEHVAQTLKFCQMHKIPVTTRGAGTNTVGATVPEAEGLVLSLERMNQILEYRPQDRLLVCEAGARNGDIQRQAAADALFWPPDPTSADFCTVGGNLGCNAGGPKAVKYGTCRENTLGLTAVTAQGEIIHTGCRTTKGVVAYDLTRLLIGSEGTLAVITQANLLLSPLPPEKYTIRAAYADVNAACEAVAAIMAQAARPCALEFMDGTAVKLVRQAGYSALPEDCKALLLIEIDGDEQSLPADALKVQKAGKNAGCLDWSLAADVSSRKELWQARKVLSPCLRSLAPKKINEDVVVPVSCLPALINGLEQLSQKHDVLIVNFGHAGNGNVHVNLLADPSLPGKAAAMDNCLSEVFDLVLSLGGTLSGEHGVGLAKRPHIAREIDPVSLQLMRDIKARFDPAGILNPGKVFP